MRMIRCVDCFVGGLIRNDLWFVCVILVFVGFTDTLNFNVLEWCGISD